MAKRSNDSFSITEVLKDFIETNNLQKGIDEADIKIAWKELMGPGVSNYTKEVLFRKNILYVSFTSAVLREELMYGKDKIMKMINEHLKREVIKDIVFK